MYFRLSIPWIHQFAVWNELRNIYPRWCHGTKRLYILGVYLFSFGITVNNLRRRTIPDRQNMANA